MEFSQFHPQKFERGKKFAVELDIGPSAPEIKLPLLLVRGSQSGNTLVVTAAVHGDEYEGVQAVFKAFHRLDPETMSGDFLSVPVANPPAFWSGTRLSPLDSANLARVFPGSLQGGPTSTIAYHLANFVIARADFFLDLHSGGVRWSMPTLVGYNASDPRSRDAALIFGTPVVWGHPVIAAGRTISFATEHGIPWLYTEAHGGARIDPSDLRLFVDGIFNLMRHLHIVPGNPPTAEVKWHLYGDGSIDEGLLSKCRGFCTSRVVPLQEVSQGEVLGETCNLLGETLETYLAPSDGVVAMVRQFPVVEPGELLFLTTGMRT